VQVSLLDQVGDRLIRPGYRRVLRKRLVSTGRQDMSSYRTLVRRKVVGLVVGLVYGGYIEFDGTASGLFMTVLFAAVGFVLPDVLTYNTGTKRAQQLDRSLADAIDILNLCVESGLTFQAAMAQAANILKGPIAEEFSRVLRQMQLGQPMIQSMQDMAARNKNQDLDRFITVIVQSEKLGIPISAVLAEQAKEMRGKRREKARERAQKVPVKILMPVMLCFLPGIFIVVLGPAIISIMSAFSG
jgi:tight adherence protein C